VIMKQTFIVISILLMICSSVTIAYACTIANAHAVYTGYDKLIEGACSNNDQEVSCEYGTGVGVKCDGPEGSYSGQDLSTIIYSVCGCSLESLPELQIEQQIAKTNNNK